MTTTTPPPHAPTVHMIGIGGAGMSALARLYLQEGRHVTGSDQAASQALSDLDALGAQTYVGSDPTRLAGADLVVYSSAVPANDPELAAATRLGLRAIKHAQALGEVFNTRRGIAVAGTHGKTTTTSMIAYVLERAGWSPSFQIGGESVDLGTSARLGSGEWMVVEADEFDRRFLAYAPEIAVLNNVEPDHFEYYGTVKQMEGAFAEFLTRLRPGGTVIAWGEDQRLARLLPAAGTARVVRFGMGASDNGAPLDYRAEDVRYTAQGSQFRVTGTSAGGAAEEATVELPVPGEHNVRNALAALATTHTIGVPLATGAAALATFHGARRRFQLLAHHDGIRVYEDYAHHPTAVRLNLEAARRLVPVGGRLWAVFQPHLLTRTERLFDEFAASFDAADMVLLTEVYSPAGREPAGQYRRSPELVQAIRERGHPSARYVPTLAEARAVLAQELRPGDVALVMGAGTIDTLGRQAAEDVQRRVQPEASTGHTPGTTGTSGGAGTGSTSTRESQGSTA